MITNEQHIEKVALVIEDDKSVSQLIRLYLAEDGYRVLNAEDGLSGLKMATEESPDIVPVSYTHLTLPTNREV